MLQLAVTIIILVLIRTDQHKNMIVEGRISESMSPSGCSCPGDQLTFDCLVEDGVATVWQGSAFDCNNEGPNTIILRHSQFSQHQPAAGEIQCNGGRILARSIGVLNGIHISELNVTVTEDMNNKIIECTAEYTNGTQSNSGTSIVTVATDSIAPPDNIHLAEVSRGQLKFKWFSNNDMCPTDYTYSILSSNCGACPNVTANRTATCHVLNNHRSQVCTFAVQILVCGNVFGNASDQFVTVMVKVPDPPEFKSTPHYQGESLINIQTTWIHNMSLVFNITDGIDGSPISYTIVYSDSLSNNSCGLSTIPGASCERMMCSDLFKVSASSCSPSSNINVSIFATNILGDGPLSDPVMVAAGLSSNGIPEFLPYVVSIVCLSVLLLALCTVFSVTVMVRSKRAKKQNEFEGKRDFKSEDHMAVSEQQKEDTVVYEEIDELQQIPKTIHISKNMAYCHFHDTNKDL